MSGFFFLHVINSELNGNLKKKISKLSLKKGQLINNNNKVFLGERVIRRRLRLRRYLTLCFYL